MNKRIHSLPIKIIAIVLFVVTVAVTLLSATGVFILIDNDFYTTQPPDFFKSTFCVNEVHACANDIYNTYLNTYIESEYTNFYFEDESTEAFSIEQRASQIAEKYSSEKSNLFFNIKDENGIILLSNYSEQNYSYMKEYAYSVKQGVSSNHNYIITCYVRTNLSANDHFSIAKQWFDIGFSMRYALIITTIIGGIISLSLFVFLICAAGHRKGKEGVFPNGIDKLPFDLYTAVIIGITSISVAITGENFEENIFYYLFILFVVLIDIVLSLSLCMTFATRYKLGGWWKNTLTYLIFKFTKRFILAFTTGIRTIFGSFSILWKAILVFGTISVVELFFIASSYNELSVLLFFWFVEKLIFAIILCYAIIHLNNLKKGAEMISSGNIDYKIDTRKMFLDFKRHGDNLNNISNGLSKAVEERMKSERFKTELITNVSHDIKTPLTSIVNYVDLIKKENIDNETVQQYIEVLDRQSARLKKMTEDLVEASKASTGNLKVNSTRTDIKELLVQAVGEYNERLQKCSLEPILTLPDSETAVYADGRLLWRVFDNLLGNICKYSLSATRVYFTITDKNDKIEICFKNISKYPLNISSSELMERFVRGDSARTTEGSGLGLSIAKSLTELQNGAFEILIDGDLFKAVITFVKLK